MSAIYVRVRPKVNSRSPCPPHGKLVITIMADTDKCPQDDGAIKVATKEQDNRTISNLYPNLKGLLLWNAMSRDHMVSDKFTANFFTRQGLKALSRHEENIRDVEAEEEMLAGSVEREGVQVHYRGAPIIMPSKTPEQLDMKPEECEMFDVLAGGSLSTGVYIAAARSPNNVYVRETLKMGLRNCILLNSSCPACVAREIVNSANLYHKGASTTFITGYKLVPICEVADTCFV